MATTIEVLDHGEWWRLRDLRSRALRDSPTAFWATWEDEGRFTSEQWRGFASAAAWFVAHDEGRDVGLAGVLSRAEAAGSAEVIGMWVDPDRREQGTARALLTSVDGWALGHEIGTVVLWVVDANAAARAAYARLGFVETGETAPMPAGRTGTEIRMKRTPQ